MRSIEKVGGVSHSEELRHGSCWMDLEGEGGKRSLEICSRSSSGGKSSRWASRSHRCRVTPSWGLHVGDPHYPYWTRATVSAASGI